MQMTERPQEAPAGVAAHDVGHHVIHYEIEVKGSVHSVGYRPFVARLACSLGVTGRVWNTSSAVRIEATGYRDVLDEFVRRLVDDAPELADIDALELRRAQPPRRASVRFDIAATTTPDSPSQLRL